MAGSGNPSITRRPLHRDSEGQTRSSRVDTRFDDYGVDGISTEISDVGKLQPRSYPFSLRISIAAVSVHDSSIEAVGTSREGWYLFSAGDVLARLFRRQFELLCHEMDAPIDVSPPVTIRDVLRSNLGRWKQRSNGER